METLQIYFHICGLTTQRSILKSSSCRKQRPRRVTGLNVRLHPGQTSIPELFNKAQKYERTTRRWCEITDLVTYCISKDMLPFFTTEKKGFWRLIQTLDTRYEIPSAKYFSNIAIPALYEKTRDLVSSNVANARYFSATADMWSSSVMEPHLSYSVHIIDDNWRLQTRCLQTLVVPKDHTADNLCDVLTETLA